MQEEYEVTVTVLAKYKCQLKVQSKLPSATNDYTECNKMYLKLFVVNFIDRTVWYKYLDTWHKKQTFFSVCVCIVLFFCILFSFVFLRGFFVDWGVFCVNLLYILLNPTIADSICSRGGVVQLHIGEPGLKSEVTEMLQPEGTAKAQNNALSRFSIRPQS